MKRVIATCALVVAATSAFAEDRYSVVIDEKDFRTEKTVKALYQRIRKEARSACPSYFVSRNMREIANCRADVEADLVQKIDHPLLHAYVQGAEQLRIALAEREQRDDRS